MNRTIEERNKKVEDNMKLVYHVCKKMWNWAKGKGFGGEFDDLVSVGSLAMIEAAANYDEKRGFRFSTFAHKYIKNAIITESKRGGLIRIPIYSEEQYYDTCKSKNKLESYFEMKAAKKSAYRIANLSDFTVDEDDYSITPRQLVAPKQPDPVIDSELRDMVKTKLKDNYRKVIVKHFWEDKSNQEIAKEMGFCRCEITRKRNMAIKQLQKCYGVS